MAAATSHHDICIIGAGMAGLYCALELSKKYPTMRICILEKYPYIGGRTSTFHHDTKAGPVQWEAGAGRIHNSHTNVIKLIDHYGLSKIPIGDEIEIRSSRDVRPVEFSKCLATLGLDQLDPLTLRTHTLKDLANKIMGPTKATELLDTYEYRSELDTLKADNGLYSLNHELGNHTGFFVIKEGFSALVGAMKRDIESRGVEIMREYEVSNIIRHANHYKILVKDKSVIHARKVIVAVTRDALAEIPCFKGLPILKQVKMRPLVRMYAVFPKVNGSIWFANMKKFVCPKPIRYVIPMDPEQGTIMISYTDGADAEYWIKKLESKGESAVFDEVMKEIHDLFPHISIPAPLYFKIHPWADGCSYWTPGDYDFNKVSKSSVKPLRDSMPGVYMCGESWAYAQAWVKCAIDQADHALNALYEDI